MSLQSAVNLIEQRVAESGAARRGTAGAVIDAADAFAGAAPAPSGHVQLAAQAQGAVSFDETDRAAPHARALNAELGKRVVDVCAALALLVALAPLLVFVAILIKLDSAGPVLYRQQRIGRHGAPFLMYKFRSMIVDAEKDGVRWASKNDPRVTRLGRFIRKTRIDEIPQTLNVLRGEMSFVGPRPERPEFVCVLEREIPDYHLRHAVKPGITGWAQVKYVYTASIEDARIKLCYDLEYIRNFNLLKDIKIIVMTVRVALFGLGSR